LFTFVISLVVVGAALFFATRIAIGAAPKPDKPATPVTGNVVGRHLAPEPVARWAASPDLEGVSAARRIRSGVLLIVMLTVLGAIAALVLVIGGALVLSGLRSAVQ
jgi:hypothetical protein